MVGIVHEWRCTQDKCFSTGKLQSISGLPKTHFGSPKLIFCSYTCRLIILYSTIQGCEPLIKSIVSSLQHILLPLIIYTVTSFMDDPYEKIFKTLWFRFGINSLWYVGKHSNLYNKVFLINTLKTNQIKFWCIVMLFEHFYQSLMFVKFWKENCIYRKFYMG